MITIARQLKEVVDAAKPSLLAIPEDRASEKPHADKWSFKQILGHLVDSAANNHQRFVRMQESPDIGKFSYTQQHWVNVQAYQSEPWEKLVEFWHLYNLHLAHVIAHVDSGSLDHICDMGYSKPATLRFVMEDYVRHVEHHLKQILSEADPMEREHWVRREPH